MLIKKDFCLKPFNTFGVRAFARRLAVIGSLSDLEELYQDKLLNNDDTFILGEGSNVLFTKHYEGLILLNQIRKMEVLKENSDWVYLKVNGGENWTNLVDYTVDKGWGGLENLSLIPGTVGAAPVQNIGAYGVEVKDIIESVSAYDMLTGKTVSFLNDECGFGYRNSIFKSSQKGRYFILNVVFRLSKKPVLNLEYAPLKKKFENRDTESISLKELSEAIKEIRLSKLPEPEKLANAGSFFKNPVIAFSKIKELLAVYPDMPFYKVSEENYKLAAGWLIEKAGWKGRRIGDAGVHEKQALVIVNYGKATGKEIYFISKEIQSSVEEKFGVNLVREVTVL